MIPVVGESQKKGGGQVGKRLRENIKKASYNACTRHAVALICSKQHICSKQQHMKNTPLEECNQRWLGFRDREAPLHLSPCKQNPSSAWRVARRRWQLRFREALPQPHAHALWSSQLLAPMCDNMMFVESCYKCLQ